MFLQIIRKRALLICLAAMMAVPAVGTAQVQEDDQVEGYEVPELEAPEQGSSGSFWNNEETQGSGTSLGIQQDEGATAVGGTRGGSTAGGLGTLGNPTPDNRDPGGNPDVPFDPVMNLIFLAGGLVFAFWVYRRKLADKPAPVRS